MFAKAIIRRGRLHASHEVEQCRVQLSAPLPRHRWYLPCKAVFDVLVALIVLALALPFLLVLAACIKVTSRGPALYTQIRVGKGGRPYVLYKLRTMTHDCERQSGPQWSLPGDPRVTRVGRYLRRFHLDELPQLWNVVKGDMSLIGPRPERPEFVPILESAIPYYRRRLQVRPGLTGLAQVQFPADTDLESVVRKLTYDLYYVRALSPWLDLKIVVCTALHVVGVPYHQLRCLFRLPSQERVESAYRTLTHSVPAGTSPAGLTSIRASRSLPTIVSMRTAVLNAECQTPPALVPQVGADGRAYLGALDPFARPATVRVGLDLLLFLTLHSVLLIRPQELIPALDQMRIYNWVILVCLAVSLPGVLGQLSPLSLHERPITLCLLGVLVTVFLSSLAQLNFYDARIGGWEFTKILAYYLLLVATLQTSARLQSFVRWFVLLAFVAALLAVLNHYGYVVIPGLDPIVERYPDPVTGEINLLERIRGTGMFNDPNDLCLLLVAAMAFCLFNVIEPRSIWVRGFWLLVLAALGFALVLTYSRGGFLAMLTAMLVLFCCRFGWRTTIPLAALALAVLFAVAGGRQTELSTSEGTAQQRIQIWSEAYLMVREGPLLGIGQGQISERIGYVAHNSFVHALTELGIVGGLCFLGVFYFSVLIPYRLKDHPALSIDPTLKRLRPYLMAAVCGSIAGMFSLSRCYTVTTYVLPAMITAYGQAANGVHPTPVLRLDGRLLRDFIVTGIAAFIGVYILIRLLVHFG